METEWGFLLIDVRNVFNEINRRVVLWVVRLEWLFGAHFCFNGYYQHIAILVNPEAMGKSVIISSQEGVPQGDPLSMRCHGVGILLLIQTLKSQFPAAKQQCFADDGSAAGKFTDISVQFEQRQQVSSNYYGYFPESSLEYPTMSNEPRLGLPS